VFAEKNNLKKSSWFSKTFTACQWCLAWQNGVCCGRAALQNKTWFSTGVVRAKTQSNLASNLGRTSYLDSGIGCTIETHKKRFAGYHLFLVTAHLLHHSHFSSYECGDVF